jgi:hypothetical protein
MFACAVSPNETDGEIKIGLLCLAVKDAFEANSRDIAVEVLEVRVRVCLCVCVCVCVCVCAYG